MSENSINSLQLLEDRLSILGEKAGPVLFQLPPNFEADADDWPPSLLFFPRAAGTVSNFATRAGTQQTFLAYCPIGTLHFASRIT